MAARTEEPFSWSFTVLDSDVINAFAFPGRRVFVNRGLLASPVDSSEAMSAARLMSQGTLLKFSRDQEAEADVLGVRYMTAAGYNPHAMMEVLEILSRTSEALRQEESLSTHPHPQTGMRVLEDLLNAPYRHTHDTPDFGRYAERFRQQGERISAQNNRRPAKRGFAASCGVT